MNRREILLVFSILIVESSSMATSAPLQTLALVSADSFQAIRDALTLVPNSNAALSQLRADVVQAGANRVVLLSPQSAMDGSAAEVGVHVDAKRVLLPSELNLVLQHLAQTQLLGSLLCRHFFAIDQAMRWVQQERDDLSGYKIELVREGPALIVLFSAQQREVGTRGSLGLPGFEVEIEPDTLRVVRANRVR